MYDMYPDWGPARHREPQDRDPHLQLMQEALDPRDSAEEPPDDN
jgi:hypothetical protein